MDIVTNPGIEFELEASGTVVISVPYYTDSIAAAVSGIPREYLGLGLETMRGKERPSSKGFDVMVRYAGLTSDASLPDADEDQDGDWEIDSEFEENPIKSHHLLPLIMERYEGYYEGGDEDGEVKFPKTLTGKPTGDGRGLAGKGNKLTTGPGRKNPAHGLESYFVTGAIVRRTRIMATVPDDFFRRIDRVIPRPPIPALSRIDWGDRNFLTLVPRPRKRGNAVEMVEEWKLSAPGGWTPLINGLIDSR
jgi:hypothetical protein